MAETINRGSPAEWEPYLGRRPVVAGQMGALMFVALPIGTSGQGRVVNCAAGCGAKRMDMGGQHAPRFVDGAQVDCIGNEVPA